MISMSWPQYVDGHCTYKNKKVKLSRGERDLLLILLLKRGIYVSFQEITEALWPSSIATIDAPVNLLKKRLGQLKEKIPGVIISPRSDHLTIDPPYSKLTKHRFRNIRRKHSIPPVYSPCR